MRLRVGPPHSLLFLSCTSHPSLRVYTPALPACPPNTALFARPSLGPYVSPPPHSHIHIPITHTTAPVHPLHINSPAPALLASYTYSGYTSLIVFTLHDPFGCRLGPLLVACLHYFPRSLVE
ncbi:hypothetical protein VTO73DRAFT_13172 [Trametes versicolor]